MKETEDTVKRKTKRVRRNKKGVPMNHKVENKEECKEDLIN